MTWKRTLNPLYFKNEPGFTLIELLIVIAIIAVLSTIGSVIYSGFQKNARDAKRKIDIESIASALEANYGQTAPNQYGTLNSTMFTSGNIPQDPLGTNDLPDNSCPGVCKYCVLEGSSTQYQTSCSQSNTKVVSSAYPSGGSVNVNWTVCANLENGGFFCKSSGR